jgi:hypothetical protein
MWGPFVASKCHKTAINGRKWPEMAAKGRKLKQETHRRTLQLSKCHWKLTATQL